MSRTILITGYCDGEHVYTGGSSLQALKRCGKSIEARSHKKLTEKIKRVGWQETPEGVLKCSSCLAREARGEQIRYVKKAG